MRKENSIYNQNKAKVIAVCPILSCYDLIDGRWKTHVIWCLREGSLRFGEIRKAIPLATERMVARRISELLEQELIQAVQKGENKTYTLTNTGKMLLPLLEDMMVLGKKLQNTKAV